MAQENEPVKMAGVIQIDEQPLQDHLGKMVQASVEETLNQLLDAEADRICGAGRYEHTPDRLDTRAGSYERKLQTRVGEVKLKVPKLRSLPLLEADDDIVSIPYKDHVARGFALSSAPSRQIEGIVHTKWRTRRYLDMDRLREVAAP